MRSSFEGGGLAQTRQMNILLYFLIRMAIQNFNAEEASEPNRTYIIKYSTYAVLPQNNFSRQIRAHITQNAFNINNLDTDERLGCGKMKEDGKNSWLARNRGGGKVGKVH